MARWQGMGKEHKLIHLHWFSVYGSWILPACSLVLNRSRDESLYVHGGICRNNMSHCDSLFAVNSVLTLNQLLVRVSIM